MLVQHGVGINFSPRPNNECRLLAGCFLCVKSWNAKWEGREKKYHVGVWASVDEALCNSVLFGSVTNPNCCFILFVTVVMTCSDRWRKAFSSVVIVNACASWSFCHFRLRQRCWYHRLFLLIGWVVEGLVFAFDALRWTARVVVVDRIPSTTPGAEPPRDARDSGSARSHSTHLETSSSDRPKWSPTRSSTRYQDQISVKHTCRTLRMPSFTRAAHAQPSLSNFPRRDSNFGERTRSRGMTLGGQNFPTSPQNKKTKLTHCSIYVPMRTISTSHTK